MIYKQNCHFKEIEHTADVGICASGPSLPGLFASALYGMYSVMLGDTDIVENDILNLDLKEDSLEELLNSWLSEINYLALVKKFFVHAIPEMQITESDNGYHLKAKLSGDLNPKYDQYFQTEIKAITYHQLKIEKSPQGYTAQIIFDI